MIKVKSKFTINKIRIKELEQAAVKTLEETGEALHTEVVQKQVVPRDTGNLQNESFHVDKRQSRFGKLKLVHSAPYARRLYYHPEYNFHRGEWFDEYGEKHEGNIAAGGKWFDPWLPGGTRQDFVPKTFRRLYRRNAKLKNRRYICCICQMYGIG